MDIQVCAMTGVFCHVLIEWNVLGLGVFGMSLFPFSFLSFVHMSARFRMRGILRGMLRGSSLRGSNPAITPAK